MGQVRAAGVQEIQGRVIGDGSLFEAETGSRGRAAALTYNNTRSDAPALHAAQKITDALRADGVSIKDQAAEGTAPPSGANEVGFVDSPTMLSLLTKAGHDSDNVVAETLSKVNAAQDRVPTSTRAGATLIQEHAKRQGASIKIKNGSGLGTANRCSPASITEHLRAMSDSVFFAELVGALPRAGTEGTLRERMRTTLASQCVRAKTGTLTHRSAGSKTPAQDSLAGYVFGNERRVAFSIVREMAETRFIARTSIDRMVDTLAHYCHPSRTQTVSPP